MVDGVRQTSIYEHCRNRLSELMIRIHRKSNQISRFSNLLRLILADLFPALFSEKHEEILDRQIEASLIANVEQALVRA